jgi:hypothetical protein
MPNRELDALRITIEATRRLRIRPSRPFDELDEIEAEASEQRRTAAEPEAPRAE